MTTYYGLNPSFAGPTGRLPLLANFLQRGRRFEVLDSRGLPTGDASPVAAGGFPIFDGRTHGVRVFDGMDGQTPPNLATTAKKLTQAPGGLVTIGDDAWTWGDRCFETGARQVSGFHGPSISALRAWKPAVLRTLDLSLVNKWNRAAWDHPRVLPEAPLQATDLGMAVELQARLANLCDAQLWWNAPPRLGLDVDLYVERITAYLVAIRDTVKKPPILEYGNELWNDRISVANQWLKQLGESYSGRWRQAAAFEISLLNDCAAEVFGAAGVAGSKPYYVFVGGQLTDPSVLGDILGHIHDFTPDLAGPALYVTPLKEQMREWEVTNAIPAQDELRASCFTRLEELTRGAYNSTIRGELAVNDAARRAHGVPYFALYEAGQSLIAKGKPWKQAALQAQREVWMGELYRAIRREADRQGVHLVNWYSFMTDQTPGNPAEDVFGLLEGLTAPELPKAKAARGE